MTALASEGEPFTAEELQALRASLEPEQHYRVGPAKCACGFDAYKIQGIMVDYGAYYDLHMDKARRGPTYRPLPRETALRLVAEVERLTAFASAPPPTQAQVDAAIAHYLNTPHRT